MSQTNFKGGSQNENKVENNNNFIPTIYLCLAISSENGLIFFKWGDDGET